MELCLMLICFKISLQTIDKVKKEQRKNISKRKQQVFTENDGSDLRDCHFRSLGFFSHFSLRTTFQFITNEQRCFIVRSSSVVFCSGVAEH